MQVFRIWVTQRVRACDSIYRAHGGVWIEKAPELVRFHPSGRVRRPAHDMEDDCTQSRCLAIFSTRDRPFRGEGNWNLGSIFDVEASGCNFC